MKSRHVPAINREAALSPVIGEMLMIVLAILLVSLFSVSLAGLLPEGRDYTVDINHNETVNQTFGTIDLWHKGGDWVEASNLEVIVIPNEGPNKGKTVPLNFTLCSYDAGQSKAFNLGDHILITVKPGVLHPSSEEPLQSGDIVRLVSSRNVIFSGTANPVTAG